MGALALLWWAPGEEGREFYSAAAGLIPVLLLTIAVQQGATARVHLRAEGEPWLGWAAAQVRRVGAVLALAALIGAELCALYTIAKGKYDDLPFFREPDWMFAAVAFGLGIIGTIAVGAPSRTGSPGRWRMDRAPRPRGVALRSSTSADPRRLSVGHPRAARRSRPCRPAVEAPGLR